MSFFSTDKEISKFFVLAALFCARSCAYLINQNWFWMEILWLEQLGGGGGGLDA